MLGHIDSWRASLVLQISKLFMFRDLHEDYYSQRLSNCLMDDFSILDIDDAGIQSLLRFCGLPLEKSKEITINELFMSLKDREFEMWLDNRADAYVFVNELLTIQAEGNDLRMVDMAMQYIGCKKVTESLKYALNECHVNPADRGLGGSSCYSVVMLQEIYDDSDGDQDFYRIETSDPVYLSSSLRGAVAGVCSLLGSDCKIDRSDFIQMTIQFNGKDVIQIPVEVNRDRYFDIKWSEARDGDGEPLESEYLLSLVPARELARAKRNLVSSHLAV